MQYYAPMAAKLPKAFWLNIINSLIAQIMTENFNPGNFFGETGKLPVVSAKELVAAANGSHSKLHGSSFDH